MTDLDTRLLYTALVVAVALERVVEMALSRRNIRLMLLRGGIEAGAGHYPAMVALHTAFLLACPLEVWLLDRPWQPALGWTAVALLAGTMALRYWVIASLGSRWNTRIVLVPGEPLVRTGPFRLLRHPNYLAVALEIVALPLIHGAWLTATVFGLANLALLRVRIRAENDALCRHAAPDPAPARVGAGSTAPAEAPR